MIVNNTNDTRFRGMYKLPNTPKNLADIEKYVEPMYSKVRHEAFFPFIGKSPFKVGIDALIQNIAEKEGYPISWLKMNAENHGADFSELSEDNINIVCGNIDFNNFLAYLKSRTNTKKSVFEKIKNLFHSSSGNSYDEKPEHLRLLFHALDRLKIENSTFAETFKSKIIEVKTPQELLAKMLCEK